ncbi:hypothetical protein NMY22_g130 [Coprinellus aureogranulatus]|nr:hypothetical protein NMY22_g130 [Coprinellus aureogranulatus]
MIGNDAVGTPRVFPSTQSSRPGDGASPLVYSLLDTPTPPYKTLGTLWMTWFAANPLRYVVRSHLSAQGTFRHVLASPRVAFWPRSSYSSDSNQTPKPEKRSQQGSLNVGHSHFISNASPGEKWKPGFTSFSKEEEPSVDELEGVSEGRGKLLPTSTHLFKLILPLGNLSDPANTHQTPKDPAERNPAKSNVPPTVMLLHPSQPLSHVGSLIRASLSPANPIPRISGTSSATRSSAQFFIHLTYHPSKELSDTVLKQTEQKTVQLNEQGATKDPQRAQDPLETVIEVQVPTFADRTRYLRRKLQHIERQIASMEDLKLHCDKEAHRGARRMAVTGFGMLVVYWGAVARLTFWDYGWDIMEPITYLSGLSTVILGYLWFLYQGREVSYSSVLAQSISKRRDQLYRNHGFDIERWVELVGERKSLRREIGRIAEDYEERVAHDFEDEAADELDEGTRKRKATAEDVVKDSLAKAEGKSEERKEENIGRKMATKVNREE